MDLVGRYFSSLLEVSNASLLRAMVAGGVGIGFVQELEASEGAEAGRFVVLDQYRATVPLTFVHPKGRASDAVLTHFTQALADAWETVG